MHLRNYLDFRLMNLPKNNFFLIDLNKIDLGFFCIFLTLSLFGLIILASASVELADSMNNRPLSLFLNQFVKFFIGILVLFSIFFIPLSFWERIDLWLLFFGIMLLLLVFIPGIGFEANGANRWIRIFGFSLQPSEIMKFISIIYIASYSVRRVKDLQTHWFAFFKPAVLIVLILSLILLQPDLGTSVVIFLTLLGVLFVSGVQLKQFLIVIGTGVVGILSLIIFVPWRWERIISFTDPWNYANDSGYQLTQSLMAIGRGDWFGVGVGEGLMKMGYLPDAHTDFIFSVIVEELGILTGIIVIGLLFALTFRCFFIGREALKKNLLFGFFSAYGVAILIGTHTLINVGVASGLLPTKGLTLPFISYGGTNLIVMCAMIGLILKIDYETKMAMPVVNISRRAHS
jgi:cell division protein FtsW|tara:strand:+ start:1429 stop:2634 length:1206 start_codon:yes stop_codon:yes gene_type:complete